MLPQNTPAPDDTGLAQHHTLHNDCTRWFAVQTVAGHEKKLTSTIRRLCPGKIQLYLPARQVIHKTRGEQYITELPLFPGYIFVHKAIDDLLKTLDASKVRIIARPVTANGKYLEARRDEMKFLFDIAGQDGVIKISKGIVAEGDNIRILKGPLKNFKGKILFINRRKNKAKVRIEIMNRTVDVSLGLDIILPGTPEP